MRVGVIGSPSNEASAALVDHWRSLGLCASLLSAGEALEQLRPGDVAVARLDVLATLDGVEPGLVALLALERRGIRVVNPVRSLLVAHDKLRTADVLRVLDLPHPETAHLRPGDRPPFAPPLVLKPRFGSWGADVELCSSADETEAYLARVRGKSWYRRHGVLAQKPVPSPGYDVRALVAGGRLVGAVRRMAALGEWRTNISCGGTAAATELADPGAELAVTAAAVAGCELVGVDLMPVGESRYVVLELNAAVEFDAGYSGQHDVFAAAASALRLERGRTPRTGRLLQRTQSPSPSNGTALLDPTSKGRAR